MYREILMTMELAAQACLWTFMAATVLAEIIFIAHRKKRRLDYLVMLLVTVPFFMLSTQALVSEITTHVNLCYPPTPNFVEERNDLLLLTDMVALPIIIVFSAIMLKAGRITAIIWAKTADKAKAFHAFGQSVAVSLGRVQDTMKKEGAKVRSLNFVNLEVEEDEC